MSSQAEKVIEIVKSQLKYDGEINLDSKFEDMGADSLDQVELVMAIESEFGIEIPDSDSQKISNVGDAVKIVDKLMSDSGKN